MISIHALCEEGDPVTALLGADLLISIHALCEEGDGRPEQKRLRTAKFLSTPSARRATDSSSTSSACSLFLSTPSARRATRIVTICNIVAKFLSTPSARRATALSKSVSTASIFLSTPSARRATAANTPKLCYKFISIHALCEEGDGGAWYDSTVDLIFLSTPSARRATHLPLASCLGWRISIHALCEEGDPRFPACTLQRANFYPRPLRGGRPPYRYHLQHRCKISIHALCEEGDAALYILIVDFGISIHALCEEGDPRFPACTLQRANFYPRPLRGGRPRKLASMLWQRVFLSTPSARRATAVHHRKGSNRTISIHALCEEGDLYRHRPVRP